MYLEQFSYHVGLYMNSYSTQFEAVDTSNNNKTECVRRDQKKKKEI